MKQQSCQYSKQQPRKSRIAATWNTSARDWREFQMLDWIHDYHKSEERSDVPLYKQNLINNI